MCSTAPHWFTNAADITIELRWGVIILLCSYQLLVRPPRANWQSYSSVFFDYGWSTISVWCTRRQNSCWSCSRRTIVPHSLSWGNTRYILKLFPVTGGYPVDRYSSSHFVSFFYYSGDCTKATLRFARLLVERRHPVGRQQSRDTTLPTAFLFRTAAVILSTPRQRLLSLDQPSPSKFPSRIPSTRRRLTSTLALWMQRIVTFRLIDGVWDDKGHIV